MLALFMWCVVVLNVLPLLTMKPGGVRPPYPRGGMFTFFVVVYVFVLIGHILVAVELS